MNELALHILDIVQNSIAAGASLITIEIREDAGGDELVIVIEDDGSGMTSEWAEKVVNPFFTSRTTRKVGLGLPLFKAGAESCDGRFALTSQLGKGTRVEAVYRLGHIDRPPLGNMVETMLALIVANPHIDFCYDHRVGENRLVFDTRQVREVLGEEADLGHPMVYQWMKETLSQEYDGLNGGA